MKKQYRILLIITMITVSYSLIKMLAYNENFNSINFLSNSILLLALSIIITLIWSIFRFKKWGLLKVFFRSHILALVLITIVLSVGKYNNLNLDKQKDLIDKDVYKKIVSDENKESIKKVGDVKQEFLNEDNFYENYVYNYAIKFPSNYKLNYGIGEYSNIMAFNENNGNQISVTTGDNNINYSFSNKEANKMIDSFEEKQLDFFSNELIKKWEYDGSFQSVKVASQHVVNFYNKKFIKLTFEASRNLNDVNYKYTITNYITFFKENNYHFYFESPIPKNKNEWSDWNKLVLGTMNRLRISNSITQ